MPRCQNRPFRTPARRWLQSNDATKEEEEGPQRQRRRTAGGPIATKAVDRKRGGRGKQVEAFFATALHAIRSTRLYTLHMTSFWLLTALLLLHSVQLRPQFAPQFFLCVCWCHQLPPAVIPCAAQRAAHPVRQTPGQLPQAAHPYLQDAPAAWPAGVEVGPGSEGLRVGLFEGCLCSRQAAAAAAARAACAEAAAR